MFLFYCNKCFRDQELQPELQLYLSQCSHIFCTSCLQEKCSICQRNYKPILINKDMPQSMATYFEDPLKIYKRLQKIIKFQTDQQNLYFEYAVTTLPERMNQSQRKLNGILKLESRLDEEIANEQKRIAKLKAYIAYAERHDGSGSRDTRSSGHIPSTPTISSLSSTPNTSRSDSGFSSNGRKIAKELDNVSVRTGSLGDDSNNANNFDVQQNSNDFTL